MRLMIKVDDCRCYNCCTCDFLIHDVEEVVIIVKVDEDGEDLDWDVYCSERCANYADALGD